MGRRGQTPAVLDGMNAVAFPSSRGGRFGGRASPWRRGSASFPKDGLLRVSCALALLAAGCARPAPPTDPTAGWAAAALRHVVSTRLATLEDIQVSVSSVAWTTASLEWTERHGGYDQLVRRRRSWALAERFPEAPPSLIACFRELTLHQPTAHQPDFLLGLASEIPETWRLTDEDPYDSSAAGAVRIACSAPVVDSEGAHALLYVLLHGASWAEGRVLYGSNPGGRWRGVDGFLDFAE